MLMDTHLSLFTIQLLALLSFIPKFPAGATSITRNPVYACEGENITVSCVLTVPNDGDIFTSIEISFIIGETNIPISKLTLDNIVNSFNLSRFVADAPLGNSTYLTGSITLLSYDSSTDKNLRMGCVGSLRRTGASMTESFIRTNRLLYSAPPSAPSIQSSIFNFNTATCSADIFLVWNSLSNRYVDRYFLYLDGFPLATTNSNSYIHSTILNVNTDYQYSVTAMSCAGNSTNSSANVNSVKSYSLMRSSQYVCLAYNNVTEGLTVNWELSTPTQPSGVSGLDISYSLQLLYSQIRQGVTYTYTDSTNFTLPSSQVSYNTVLTAHKFSQLDGGKTNITANLMIVQQCGQSFSGTAMECFYNSNNLVISHTSSTPISTPIPTPTSTSTSTELSSSSMSIQMNTTTVPSNNVSINSSSTLLPTSIIFALLFLMSLIVNLILIIIVILLLRRNKQSNSPSQPAPSHPYEYVDLDKMSGNISSPTQQQSPQDYVHMSSVHKQDSTQPSTHYANLK